MSDPTATPHATTAPDGPRGQAADLSDPAGGRAPRESRTSYRSRKWLFLAVIAITGIVMALFGIIGPLAGPYDGSRPAFALGLPIVIGGLLLAAVAWLFVQSRR